MTFEQIVNKVKERAKNADIGGIQDKLAIQINLTGEGEGIFYIEVKNGVLSIEPYEYYDRDVCIIVSSDNFLKIFDKKLDPVIAFTTGKLKVEGDISKALELQKFV